MLNDTAEQYRPVTSFTLQPGRFSTTNIHAVDELCRLSD
jgi:hypothetical protein